MTLDRIRNDDSTDEHIKTIEEMGCVVSLENLGVFEKMIRNHLPTTTINISQWTFYAIRSLLLICREHNLRIQMIYDGTHITVDCYLDKLGHQAVRPATVLD
ncbi:MAG: hypothetical protein GF411_07580 [Candidatus Lokiarchaeota archaeon]|nr:hypothetical protein [Candidatus Lokiarchaeota archaeon]